MKILTLGVGFWVEKRLKNNLKRKKIDFLAKNRYLLPLNSLNDKINWIQLQNQMLLVYFNYFLVI